MSRLAPIMLGQVRSGLWRVPSPVNMPVSGWTLDLTGVGTKDEFMAVAASQLDLPDHFGMNWDALWDVLSDRGTVPGSVVTGTGSAATICVVNGAAGLHADVARTFAEMLQELCEHWESSGNRGFVVWDGPEPSSIPSLPPWPPARASRAD